MNTTGRSDRVAVTFTNSCGNMCQSCTARTQALVEVLCTTSLFQLIKAHANREQQETNTNPAIDNTILLLFFYPNTLSPKTSHW